MQSEKFSDNVSEEGVAEEFLTAGDMLREERLRQNISEKEVGDQLHITAHYVRALESDNYEKLPGAVFVKGYLKNYASLLNLDEAELLGQYEKTSWQQRGEEKERARLYRRRQRGKNFPWVMLSVLGFVGGFAVLWAYNNFFGENGQPVTVPDNSTSESVEEVSALIQPSVITSTGQSQTEINPTLNASESRQGRIISNALPEITDEDSVSTNSVSTTSALTNLPAIPGNSRGQEVPAQAATDFISDTLVEAESRIIEINSAGSDVLRIFFSGESWVEVNDEAENSIYRDIRDVGDVLEITGNAPFNILLGDAPFARLTFNGTEIDVSDNIRIDNSALLTVGL